VTALPALPPQGRHDHRVEQRAHRGEVAVGGRAGGVDIGVAVDGRPVEPEAGVAGELGQEGALGAAVALAKGM
jgi:hypothetical protein